MSAPNPNPYAAPRFQPSPGAATYVSLGWRTTAATLSVLGVTLTSVALHALQVTLGDRLKVVESPPRDLLPLILVGLAGLGVLFTLLAAAVFFLVWLHRAASNLRGLGRVGMRNTPGWCVGGYFVPILNLFQPMQAMKELWQASDPQAVQGSWFASASTPLVGVWWGAWLVTGVIAVLAFFVRGEPAAEGTFGLASDATRALATVALVLLMRGIASRQAQASQALRASSAQPTGFAS
jgi:hypothetical protein